MLETPTPLRRSGSELPSDLTVAGYDPHRDAKGYRFDEAKALNAIRFFERGLVHVKGEWQKQPLILSDWQRRIVANLIGWREEDTGYRRYVQALLYIPRKNTKTTSCAGLANYFFFSEPEAGGEIYCGARDGSQAEILFNIARQMVEDGPLNGFATCYKNVMKRRTREHGLLIFKAINACADSKHGLNASVAFFDETHTYKSRKLFDVIDTSMGAREQPLVMSMTTAGPIGKSLCNDQLAYGQAVRDGLLCDPRYFPAIWETPIDADWTCRDVWEAANPNIGPSPKWSYLQRKCELAKRDPQAEFAFRQLHLNTQLQDAAKWIRRDVWRRLPRVSPEELRGEVCYLGVDLASTQDLCAVAAWFPERQALLVRQFAPEQLARERAVRGEYPNFLAWRDEGALELHPGAVIRYGWVWQRVEEWLRMFDVRAIGVDPWNAHEFANRCADEGLNVQFVRQGYVTLSAPSKRFHNLILLGELEHQHDPVMDWQIGHCVVAKQPGSDNIKPDKERSEEKIDGIAAAVTALALTEVEEEPMEIYSL